MSEGEVMVPVPVWAAAFETSAVAASGSAAAPNKIVRRDIIMQPPESYFRRRYLHRAGPPRRGATGQPLGFAGITVS